MEEKCGVDSSTLSSSWIPFAPSCSRFFLCISRLPPCPEMSSGKSVRPVLLLHLLFICPPPLFSDHVLSSAQLGYALELPATPTCQLLRISPENIAISAIQKRLLRISGECQLYNSSFLRFGQKELLQQFVAKLPCRFQH